MTFSANGEYLLTSGPTGKGVQFAVGVWRVEDGELEQTATVQVRAVECLTVSKDGRWIAAGTVDGEVCVLDTTTYEKGFSHWEEYHHFLGVDFSPDATRLVSASKNGTAAIWDIAARKRVQTLDHGDVVRAAKYSPQGDRIATATRESVRVWDTNDGRLLVHIPVTDRKSVV